MKMNWVRGHTLGKGRFGTVSLAIPINKPSKFPPIMAVKSCPVSNSESLKTEQNILSTLTNCPQIIKSFGNEITYENGETLFNLFLEFASNGNLYDHVKNLGKTLQVFDVKKHTKSILKGLCHIHDKGFAHCDIKPENILILQDGSIKIADFGLAKRVSEKKNNKYELKGTPLYMSPEIVTTGDGGSPADIWALGCVVVYMVKGTPVWDDFSPENLILRIGMGKESLEIPASLGEEGKDFLEKCFVRDPNERWTARMLLDHPFISGFVDSDDQRFVSSPKGPLDFLDWESIRGSNLMAMDMWEEKEGSYLGLGLDLYLDLNDQIGSFDGFGELVRSSGGSEPDWSDTDTWIIVR